MKRALIYILTLILILSVIFFGIYLSKKKHLRHEIKIVSAKLLNYIFLFTILAVIYTVIRENNQPISAIAWIEILAFLPIVGFILYIIFGINYRKRKMFKAKAKLDFDKLKKEHIIQTTIKDLNEIKPYYSELKLIKLLYNTDKAELTQNNKVTFYHSGKDKIDALLKELKNAKSTINLEYFSIANDETGKRFISVLEEKQKSGVEVRIIYDRVGCWKLPNNFFGNLIKLGGQAIPFLPVKLPILSSKLNYRNHRKIAIIDGKIGFIGGVNIGNKYYGLSKKYGNWRDTHIKIEGDAVYSLQKSFFRDWFYYVNEEIDTHKFFPPLDKFSQNIPIQIVSSGADSEWENIMLAYFSAFSNATDHLYVITPYLVLNESMLTAFKTAALSGVDVRIVLPHKADHWIVFQGSRSYYEDLLEAGVKIYEYNNGFPHAKMLLVDDLYVSIGSANMDIRSFSQNLEINAIIYDKRIAGIIKNQFLEDFSNSIFITYDEFKKRGTFYKAIESVCRLFSPLL